MTDIAFNTPIVPGGGVTLKAAGLVATTAANATPIRLGKGSYVAVIKWTACEIADNNELYVITFEADTKAADGTYKVLTAPVAFGATEVLASAGDTPATGTVKVAFDMPQDADIRDKWYVSGTVATGMNAVITIHPVSSLGLL